MDLRGNIPPFIREVHDVNALDLLVPEEHAFYIHDRDYLDFARLHVLSPSAAFFVIRAKSNLQYRRLRSRPFEKTTGLRCDQTLELTGLYSAKDYPDKLRRIKYHDAGTDKTFVFLTNNFNLPAVTIAELYRYRWQVELFFKWINQYLRIKSFFGTTENAVKTIIWIAVSVDLLVAVIMARLNIEGRLYTVLQVLSVTLSEQMPLNQALFIGG